MPQAVITVAGITPPPMGKKQGHIIDTVGGKWNVWGDKLPNYRMGVTYNITYEENEFNNAKFFVIKNAEPAGAAPSSRSEPSHREPQNPLPPHQSPAAVSQSIVTEKDRQIFVCALMGRAFGNPNTDPFNLERAKIAELGNACFDLFNYLFGPKPKSQGQQPRDDMDDAIPF